MSPLAKVVPYFANPLHGGDVVFPGAQEMQVSPSSLDRIFYGWIFWKAYGWNCGRKFFFSIFFLSFFSQPPKKWLIFWKSTIFHIFRSGDFCVQQTHPKNVTNRKYRSSAFQKIKIFRNRICIFENTTFLSRRFFFSKMRGKIDNSFRDFENFDYFPYKMIIFPRIL